jgi:hypothetical protein
MAFYDDEYSSDIYTTGGVTVGSSIKGEINFAQDEDWIKTTLVAGVTYVFRIYERDEIALVIRNSTRPLDGAYGQDEAGPAFEYTPTTSGDYYLSVYYSNRQSVGAYTLSALIKKPDAVPGNITSSAVLDAGATVNGKFEGAGDSDWYKFHALPGQHYAFNWPDDGTITRLIIYDSNGKPLTSSMLEVAEAGDYFIAVSGNHVGEYGLTSLLRSDDYSANSAAPGLLRVGGQVDGAIEYSGDIDRINLDLQGGNIYTLTLTESHNHAYGMMFELYDAAGNFISRAGYADVSDNPRQLTFTAQTSGTYYVAVSYNYVAMTSTHGYTLTASGSTPDDYGDTTATATAMALNTTVHGQTTHVQDIDMLKVTLKAGVTYNLKLWPDSAYSTANATSAWFSVSGQDGATGITVARADTGFTPATDGAYYIAIKAGSDKPENYLFSATIAPDDYSANAASTGRLTLNGTAKGTLELSGDRDWFALDMTAGMTYGLALKYGAGVTLSPSANQIALKLVDAQGHTLTSATPSDFSNDPVLSYTATASGKFYVEIGGGAGTYLLGSSLVQHDDAGNTPATAAVLPTGTAINGALEVSSDIDYYKLTVTAGETYAIRLKDTVADRWSPSVDITDSHGAYVRTIHNGSDSYWLVTASSSGDVYLRISSESGAPAIAYQLSATALGADDYSSDANTTGTLSLDSAVHGTFNYADDRDWFKVALTAGVTYQFNLQEAATSEGGVNTAVVPLALYASSGNPMADNGFYTYPGTAYWLGYTATASGDYYVQLQGYNGAAAGSYQLSATAIPAKPELLTPITGEAGLHQLTDNIVLTFNEAVRITADSKFHLLDEAGNAYGVNLIDQLRTFSNAVIIPAPNLHFKAGTSYKLVIDSGALVNAAGTAFEGLKNYTITTAPFAVAGTEGADYLLGRHNGATLHGGGGIDTVVYSDNDAFFHISRSGSQTVVSYQFGTTTSDTLVDVERLLFSGKAIALDIDGHGGQAYRLYQAAFGRTPDKTGLGYWINALDKGSSLTHVAGEFVNSSEFLTRSGGAASDDATFVTLLYQNVLQRAPDAGGQQYWLDALHHGATRADLLQSFSESAENQAALVGVIGNGFEYTPYGG